MKTVSIILIAAMLAGCNATGHRPIIDTKDADMANYDMNLRECQVIADQVNPATQAAVGAIGGALLGALIGRSMGGGNLSNYGAKVGALSGATGGAVNGVQAQARVVSNCMKNRGYNVL